MDEGRSHVGAGQAVRGAPAIVLTYWDLKLNNNS